MLLTRCPEAFRISGMSTAELSQDEEELRAWDWRADLKAQERGIPWLARQTGRSQQTVYLYAWGRVVTPLEWLRNAARVLGKEVAA
jgi:hypothetical protein